MASYNETAQLKGPNSLLPPGTFDPRLYAYPVMQPYKSTVNRRPIYMRFLYASAAAALIWFLCATSFSMVRHYRPWPGRPEIYPIPPHVTLEHCISYGDWSSPPAHEPWYGFPLSAVTTLDLPLSAEALLLLSRGPNSGGSVEVVTSSEQDQDVITVEVVASYFREDARDEAKVCQISRRDGEIGVGIFTRKWSFGRADRLYFATRVILPELSPESPLLIKNFETDVANTGHRLGDLNKKVLFQSLLLKGSNGPIEVESVQADHAIISTSTAAIKGTFNTSTSLTLVTSNGRIDVDIGLSSIHRSRPKLNMATSNGPIISRIRLNSEAGVGGIFQAIATTSNGRLDIDFPTAPPNSVLRLIGQTSNCPAVVSLNPAYEGSFLLQTSLFKPQVHQDKTVIDPSGKNRRRSLDIEKMVDGLVSGEVYWDDPTVQGSVSIGSSNAHVDLNL